MICKRCNGENSDQNRFCQGCGAPLEQEGNINASVHYNPYVKRAFTKSDIYTIIGFVSSLLGLFCFWLILCPLGLVLSFLGFRGNRTRTLAVCGMIISILAIIIMVGCILHDLHILPEWLTSGVFW